MESAAHFLRLVWNTRPAPRAERDLAYLYAELNAVYGRHPNHARRLIMRFRQEHKRALRVVQPSRQLPLFSDILPRPVLTPIAPNVIPLGTPFLLEEHSGPCPRCRKPLFERSRVGARIFYTCAMAGCPNRGAIFISILGTGDD